MPGSLAEKSRLIRGLVSRRDFLIETRLLEVQFQAFFIVKYGKKGGKWTKVVGISFTNYLNTIFIFEKALKLQLIDGS